MAQYSNPSSHLLYTFVNSRRDHILDPEGTDLEELLEADDIVQVDAVDDQVETLAFVVVVVVLYWWRTHEDVVAPDPHPFVNTHFLPI